MGFACPHRHRRIASQQVVPLRYGFQMVWITTGAVSTEMVELKTIRDATSMILVGNPMRIPGLFPFDSDVPVSVSESATEQPAAIDADVDFLHDALNYGPTQTHDLCSYCLCLLLGFRLSSHLGPLCDPS